MTKLITSEPNIRYFSGFTGSVGIFIVMDKGSLLIVDGRYSQQARAEVKKAIEIIEAPLNSTLLDTAMNYLKGKKISDIGYEDDKMDVASFNKLKEKFPKSKFYSISKELRDARMIKQQNEIEIIRKAALISDLAYDCVIRIIKPGMMELEISAHIDYLIKIFKGNGPAFETLVSSGKLSAYPHGKPTDKKVKTGELIVMDFGARYKGYNSDITRMVSLGNPSKKALKTYNAVLRAQESAIEKIKDGIKAAEVDKAARDVLKKEKLEKYFRHGTGHGIGLQVHEGPRVSSSSKDILKEGMVITVEPGVYLPGVGGFRIEDMVLVKKGGFEVLTKSPKKLEIL
jgi:Xaa-Pro aminopeptidase